MRYEEPKIELLYLEDDIRTITIHTSPGTGGSGVMTASEEGF